MDVTGEACVCFRPSRVEGLPDVTKVAVYPDRLEVLSCGRTVPIRFADIARPPASPGWWWRLRRWVGCRDIWMVGERDWFHPNEGKFFAFFSAPPLIVYLPADSPRDYGQSHFFRINQVMLRGGYASYDLG